MFKSIAIAATLATLGGAAAAVPAGAATFTVKNANDAGPGSLRRAISQANAVGGQDDIVFDIPAAASHVITPANDLPAVTSPVSIDGYTQPGATQATVAAPAQLVVVIDAVNATRAVELNTGASLIRGLVIQDSTGGAAADGLQVQGANNRIEGNYIGTDENGESLGMWNLADGVSITGDGNLVGGAAAAARNVIAETNDDGVTIVGAANVVAGNNLGLPLGAAALGNFGDGLSINGNGNVVGGTAPGDRNVISENQRRRRADQRPEQPDRGQLRRHRRQRHGRGRQHRERRGDRRERQHRGRHHAEGPQRDRRQQRRRRLAQR